ncbi:MAG: hypothetical protein U0R50_14685 [Gaiellales bacterium]
MTAIGVVLGVSSLAIVARGSARCFGRGSAVRAILAAALVLYAVLVGVGLVLSIGHYLLGATTVGALLIVAAFAVFADRARGTRAADWRDAWRQVVGSLAADRLLAALAVSVAIGLAYAFTLVFTPPAEGDAIVYHLARAAYWLQRGGIGHVPGNTELRIDSFPPGSDLAVAFTMMASGSLRFAGLVQFLSLLVTCAGIFGIARRLEAEPREAMFGALLFPTLSVVFMQAPTALNDIVVAALVVTATYFLLGTARSELCLGGLAITCLGLTKVTAAIAIPGILLVVLVVRGLRATISRTLIAGAATIPTVVWLGFAPSIQGQGAVGGVTNDLGGGSSGDALDAIGAFLRLSVQALELPGAAGRDALLYPIAGIATLGIAAALRYDPRSVPWQAALGIAATALLAPLAAFVWRVYRKLFDVLGRDRLELLDVSRSLGSADTWQTWYGPVAVVMTAAATVALARQPHLRWRALLAASPLLWVALLSSRGGYYTGSGRYFMGAVAISAATWGVALRWRPLAIWTVPAVVVTLVLTIVHFEERPLGIRLFDGPDSKSVWTRSYNEAVGLPGESPREALEFADRSIPADARLAVDNGLMATGFFGRHLTRTVLPIDTLGDAESADADWAILETEAAPACRRGWRRARRFSAIVVAFERVAESPACSAPD